MQGGSDSDAPGFGPDRAGGAADAPSAAHGELGTVEVSTEGMHQIPLFVSDLSAEQDKDLVLDRTDDGYVLTAATSGRTYRIEVTEAPPTTADLDAIGPRALPHEGDVEADGELAWTTPLGTVAIRAEGATRVVVVSPQHDEEEFLAIVERMGLQRVSYSIGWTAWLDISPDGVSKATAMERVRHALDIPTAALVAVGDGRNDLELLQWAAADGRGVAMGQAPDEVKAIASEVTGTVVEDGLAQVLNTL